MSDQPQTVSLPRVGAGFGEVAEMIGIGRSLLIQADKTGEFGPQFGKIGGRRIASVAEVTAWMSAEAEGHAGARSACWGRDVRRYPIMSDLTRKQQHAIECLLSPSTKTMESVAMAVGVDPRTLRRWMRDHTFKVEFDRAKREVYEQSLAGLASLSGLAVSELRRILSDAGATNREKLYACRVILLTAQNANVGDVERLVDRLEAVLEGSTT